ncbi:mediator complex subunit 13 C-terminal-domain-containing protein [Circinella umbellata]|nr:mediator complex subunit 13 C-terminal-domain-containing protein [Circinella umbellata]
MVTESSLTNILVVNGVSQIRYRAYTDACERSTLLDSLKRHDHDTSGTTTTKVNVLIQAFYELCDLNIPCTWRAVPTTSKNNNNKHNDDNDIVNLELWVFWFDERHTGRIDANDMLNQLEEVKMGTFTWETITNGLSTAKSSSSTSTNTNNNSKTNNNNNNNNRARGLVSVFEEYKLFIRSIRNVMHKSILAYGAIPLGELYIMPECNDSSQYDLLTTENYTSSTTAAIAYNTYITGTDLVFRPYTRQLRLRRLKNSDGPGTKVILSPTGEQAYITISPVEISEHSQEKVFKEWSALFNIASLSSGGSLVAIRTKANATVLYPSTLVFVPTCIRYSPTIVSGMNGVLGKNRGLIQDIGKKWDQWAWSDLFNKQQTPQDDDVIIMNDNSNTSMDGCRINYWNYNKRLFDHVIQAFGQTTPNIPEAVEHTFFQRMMEQPVTLSPIMAAKTVGTPSLSPFTLPANGATHKPTTTMIINNNDDVNNENSAKTNNIPSSTTTIRMTDAGDSLQDFIARNFSIHPSTATELPELTDAPHQQQDTLTLMHSDNNNNNNNNNETSNNTVPTNMDNVTIIEERQKPMIMEEDSSASSTALPQELPQPLQAGNLDDFGLSYGMDAFSTNHRDWDNGLDNDLGDFDFDVTEADFDFFESSGDDNKKRMTTHNSNNATLAAQLPNTAPSILPMEDVIQRTTEDTPLDLSAPPIIKQEDVSMVDNLSQQPSIPDISTIYQQQQQSTETEDTKPVSMATGISNDSPMPSDATVVGSSDAGASTAVPATFDTSIYTMTPESSRSPTLVMAKSEYTTEHQHLVPRDFAPVSFIAGVDNTKYLEGGKFRYMNDDENNDDDNKNKLSIIKTSTNQRYRNHLRRRIDYNMYRPDYIPRKLMKSRRKAARLMRGKDRIIPIGTTHSSDSDTTSSSSDDEENDDDGTTSSSSISVSSREEEDDDIDPVDRLMSAQMTYVRRLLGDIRNRPKRHRIANVMLDYDSPFSGIIVDSIHPEKLNSNDMASIDRLCQQTVWGGYPFTGVLPDSMSSSSDGTYRAEAAEAIVARQTELIQSIRGDITHVASLNGKTTHAISDFKNIMESVFHYKNEDDMLPSLGSICVKGPLKVQEYYELSAENAPVHSKYYGKFQVKKRKSGEPNLKALVPPEIVVGRQNEWVQGSTTMIGFWEKLRLEPYSSKNNILYFVVYPDNRDIATQLSMFFTNLNSVYETCQLGIHRPGSTEQIFHGAVPVPINRGDSSSTWQKGYMAACENLGAALGRAGVIANDRGISNIVIYLMNPSSQLSSNLDLSRCFSKMLSTYSNTARHHPSTKANFSTRQFAMQIVPLDHALRLDHTCTMLTLKDIVFSVYSQCHSVESRQTCDNTRAISSFYTPPWIIAQQLPETIKLSIKKPLIKFPEVIVDPAATLHMAYSFSLDRRWMVIVWSDHRGELLEFAVLEIQAASNKQPVSPLVKVFTEAWTRTRDIANRTGVAWSYVLAKIGLIFESELQAWLDAFHTTTKKFDAKVAIVSIDIESPLHFDDESLYQHQSNDEEMTRPTSATTTSDGYTFASSSSPFNTASTVASAATVGSPNVSTPGTPSSTGGTTGIKPTTTGTPTATSSINNPANSATVGLNGIKETLDGDTTSGSYMIMLNHRMAYSRQRVNIYQGDLAMEAMNELDSWILSLSTGYLIISRNPALVQGLPRSQPLALELHLVYNNLSSRTPYTALHDIIKQYHALSYVNYPPSYAGRSNTTMLPTHIALVERLCRILLVVGS